MRLEQQFTKTSQRFFPVSLDQQIMKNSQTIIARNVVEKKKEKKVKRKTILNVFALHSNDKDCKECLLKSTIPKVAIYRLL